MRSTMRLTLLLWVAAAGLGQSESEPYFALSSARTFGPGGKPNVSLSAWNVDALEFRVYRVHDPVVFFQQLEDPHQFGGRAPQPPRRRTVLEAVHRWKRGLRAQVRRSLRAQFSESPSARLLPASATRAVPSGSKGARYAEAPILNPQQLVLSFEQPVHSKTRWSQERVDVPVQEKGVYLVEAVSGQLRAYTILMVSDSVLITKTARGRIVSALVDRQTGAPLASAKVSLVTRDRMLGEAHTNADGVAELPFGENPPADLRVIARNGDDFAVNALAGYGLGASADQWMGYVYTDRPVYRPGHAVHFKGILRMVATSGYTVPAGQPISVTVNDPEQKPVYQKTLTASATGTVRDDLTLPADAALGNYFIEVKAGEAMMSGNFQVEEYKKPEYEVRVSPSQPRVMQGETVRATVDARYYFGEPVAGGKVKYAIYRERYWFPMWYDPDDEVEDRQDADDSDGGDQTNEAEGELDADGKLTVDIPTAVSDHKYDYRYRLEARVTDRAGREITGKGWVIATYGSFALNVAPQRYFFEPGAASQFTVQSRTYDNRPVEAQVHLELQKWNYRERDRAEVKGTADVNTGAAGSATATLAIPSEGGGYRVRAVARTPEGRDVESFTHIWVSGVTETFDENEARGLQIVPEKKSYRAGETARVLVIAGQPGTPVYVSVEGRALRQFKLLRSKDSAVAFDVPVNVADEPGITVSASYVRKGNLFTGVKYIKVPPVEHQLNVNLSTDKPQYLPGQTATYRIDVTGADGKPAPRAEVSLGLVDEAIYAIRRDATQDILRFFFDREWNRVGTESSLNYYFSGEAGKRRMRLAELRPASRLAQLKPDRLVQPKIRKAFPDTAFWAADLVTDSGGHAQAKVEFPDSLTTWRATARGATPDTKVGSAVLKTIVRKNLILRLAVPRFFVQGDEVVISALVHNYLATPKTARVSLDLAGLDVLDGATRDVAIPSRGEVKVDWRVKAAQVRTAKITGKALTDEESDALELELPVNVPGVKMSVARGGSIAAGASNSFDLAFPADAAAGSRSLSIRLAPSVAASLFGALDYLTSFPYGCVEQTMSSFLPNITVQQAVRDLRLRTELNAPELQEKVRAGLERLYNFQHEDGGWGWWETDESHPFMTAYVVAGLVQARSAGVDVKPEAIQKGAAWLAKDFVARKNVATDLRAYMAYALVLSGNGGGPQLSAVFDRRAELSPYGVAVLGLAFELAKDGRAAEMAGVLERTVQQDGEQAWWTATRDQLLDFSEDATPEATAYAMKLLSHERSGSPLLAKSALWLVNHRNEGAWWSSTKQTAMVIYGLIDYLAATNELNSNVTATVFVNDRPVFTRKLEANAVVAPPELRLDESKLERGANRVRISVSGAGRLYYSARAEYSSTADRLEKTGSVPLNLLRDYFRLTPSRVGDKIVYDTQPLTGAVAAGDILAVRLTVTGSEWKYLMIEDPIPAGTEFIERDNAYELRNRPPWWRYAFTRRELHDDRMAIFQTWFPRGQQQYFYLLKVVNPGVFQVSPARVAPMYQRDVMATSESRRLEVK
jgi:alpha-2-macroglobulin